MTPNMTPARKPVKAQKGKQVEKDAPTPEAGDPAVEPVDLSPRPHLVLDETSPILEVPPDRCLDTWPHADVRRLVRALDYTVSRGVGMVLLCHGCEQPLTFEGRDDGGASLMGCACAVRRWL